MRSALIHSDGGNNTLVSKQWHNKYWQPINKHGYRDYEHNWKSKTLFILGDSFIAGHGIKNIENRLSSRLSTRLDNEWTVATIAHNGWNTSDLYNALNEHEKKPDRVLISYYINDIVGAARKNGMIRTTGKNRSQTGSAFTSYLNAHSYLFNWLYVNFWLPKLTDYHNDFFERAYHDKAIWEEHTNELNKLIQLTEQLGIRPNFILWPKLTDIEGSAVYTEKVYKYLSDQGAKVINLTNLLNGRSTSSLIVNKWDGHPNIALNREVADIVYTELAPW